MKDSIVKYDPHMWQLVTDPDSSVLALSWKWVDGINLPQIKMSACKDLLQDYKYFTESNQDPLPNSVSVPLEAWVTPEGSREGSGSVRHAGIRDGASGSVRERGKWGRDKMLKFSTARSDKSSVFLLFFIHSLARQTRSETTGENAVSLVILSFFSLPSSTHLLKENGMCSVEQK